MAEYIDRADVINLITRRYENPEICEQEIAEIPAADVAPVVYGKWEKFMWIEWGDVKGPGYQCTVCGGDKVDGEYIRKPSRHCPNCGATMAGVPMDVAKQEQLDIEALTRLWKRFGEARAEAGLSVAQYCAVAHLDYSKYKKLIPKLERGEGITPTTPLPYADISLDQAKKLAWASNALEYSLDYLFLQSDDSGYENEEGNQ